MIANWLRYLFTNQYPYPHPFDRQRAQAILTINWVLVVLWLLWMATLILPYGGLYTSALAVSAVVLLFAPLIFTSIKSGRLDLASNLSVGLLLVSSGVTLYYLPQINDQFIIVLILPLALASVLYRWRGIVVVGLMLGALVFSVELLNIRRQLQTSANPFLDMMQVVLVIGSATLILAVLGGRQRDIMESTLEEINRLRVIIKDVSRIQPQTTQGQMLQQAIRFLKDTYRYDFVQVYLVDEQGRLSQRVRSGIHQIDTLKDDDVIHQDDTNAISEAARTQKPVWVSLEDTPTRVQHLLPSIQQGIAVPIVHEGVTLGVLDMQSVLTAPISPRDMDMLTLLASEVGMVLVLIRHIQTLARDLIEQQSLADRLQTQLSQLQTQRQQLIGSVWGGYLNQRGQEAIGFDRMGGRLHRAEDMPDDMRAALQKREVFVTGADDHKQINVPIVLRDEVLGAMTFAVPTDQPVTERQIELANTIALRLGAALENTRLLEQTQAQAYRERKASEVANTLITATDVDTLLRMAVDSFNSTLDAVQTQIFIEPRALTGRENGAPHSTNGDRE